jgi:tol-pal system protein YbgF
MTDRSAPQPTSRLAVFIAAAGLLFAPLALAPAAAQTQLPPPAYGTADQRQDRIEELERALNEATAENENLQRQLNEAQREITRLRGMVGELAGVNQQLQEGQQAPAEGEQPAQQPHQAPQTPQERATGELGTLPADQLPGEAGPAYSRARELLVNGRLAEAEAAFGEFLRRFPDADTAADARFWFGYTLLARNNYQEAASSFVQYLQETPNGPRAPEAQVRLGMALAGLGQQQQACTAFSSLTRRYPNAPRDVRALAQREAGVARCTA